MLTPEEITAIKAEIKRLEKAYADCQDNGIQKQIEAWIEEQREKLRSSGTSYDRPSTNH